MKMTFSLSALLVAGFLAGCAGSNGAGPDFVDVRLEGTQANQGQTGMAAFVEKGASTGLNFTISGVPSGTSSPLQLRSFIYPGSCANPGAQPAYSLNQDTQAYRGQAGWVMSKDVPVALSTLLAGSYAVVVRSSPADGNQNIFCGDIR